MRFEEAEFLVFSATQGFYIEEAILQFADGIVDEKRCPPFGDSIGIIMTEQGELLLQAMKEVFPNIEEHKSDGKCMKLNADFDLTEYDVVFVSMLDMAEVEMLAKIHNRFKREGRKPMDIDCLVEHTVITPGVAARIHEAIHGKPNGKTVDWRLTPDQKKRIEAAFKDVEAIEISDEEVVGEETIRAIRNAVGNEDLTNEDEVEDDEVVEGEGRDGDDDGGVALCSHEDSASGASGFFIDLIAPIVGVAAEELDGCDADIEDAYTTARERPQDGFDPLFIAIENALLEIYQARILPPGQRGNEGR